MIGRRGVALLVHPDHQALQCIPVLDEVRDAGLALSRQQ
jgi:hypothetical protein